MKKVVIGIIGGTGQMGQFFKNFFEKNNCKVLIHSRKDKIKPSVFVKQCDIIIISVPIDVTIDVIRKIAPHINTNSLLIDTTSIKKAPVEAMLKYSSCEVIGMHPVFGPNVSSLKNQTIVLCPARANAWLKWVSNIFEKNEARIKITTPEKHDEMMSVIQGLNHFCTLSAAHAMKNLDISIQEILEYTSPIYKLRMILLGRILNQNPNLYANIEMMNTKNEKALIAYTNSVKKLYKIIKTKDRREFLNYFNECAKFFGDFKKEAENKSDYLIWQMVDIEK